MLDFQYMKKACIKKELQIFIGNHELNFDWALSLDAFVQDKVLPLMGVDLCFGNWVA